MICHEFKGGTGTASRVVQVAGESFTVGALVQANYGARELLRVDGVPVGREIGPDVVPSHRDAPRAGSIIGCWRRCTSTLIQCQRLARRATTGAQVGGVGAKQRRHFLAFATGNHVRRGGDQRGHLCPTA
jgi:D-aminopeptidase